MGRLIYSGAAGAPELFAGAAGAPELFAGAAGLGWVPAAAKKRMCDEGGFCGEDGYKKYVKALNFESTKYCEEVMAANKGIGPAGQKGCSGVWPPAHLDEVRSRVMGAKISLSTPMKIGIGVVVLGLGYLVVKKMK